MDIKPGFLLIFPIILIVFISCNEDEILTDTSARLNFSTDTVTFDTVFTTIGTVTKLFKVRNPHNKTIRIANIYLREGGNSNFRISVDGISDNQFYNVDIPPNDSIYVFVEATLDPVSSNLPLVVEDAIVFLSNGNQDDIVLEAFGQDVHLYAYETIEDEVWTNDKPYLIYGNLTIEEGHTLQIQAGVKVYMHYNSSFEVLGTLMTEGSVDEPVEFAGDRSDYGYGESAGRWGAVFFGQESTGNKLEYTTIRNSKAGIQAGYPNEDNQGPTLELVNTQILNSSFAGIVAFNAKINAYNCIVADAQFYGIVCFLGGKYNFYHSTFSINGAFTIAEQDTIYSRRKEGSAVVLLNFFAPYSTYDYNYNYIEKNIGNDLIEANFYNCIIYGNSSQEFDTVDNGINEMNFLLDHCVVRSDSLDSTNSVYIQEIKLNKDPLFVNDSTTEGKLDFQLDALSSAKDIGNMDVINEHPVLQYDYNGNSRIADGKPDIGAFEYVE